MRARVLGSAAGGGVPQWNCGCANCQAARDGRAPRRTVASLAVTAGDGRYVLVNAGADISAQIAAYPELRPRPPRVSPIVSLLLTDANVDHAAGLLEFRQGDGLTVRSTALVKDTLCAAPMFAQFDRPPKRWRTFAAGRRTGVELPEAPELRVTAIGVPGLLPSFAGGAALPGAAVAFAFEHRGRRLVYAPIFVEPGEELARELARADAALIDGTCWSDDELIALGLGTRSSRAMGHMPIGGASGSLGTVGPVAGAHGQRYYTHINNSNPTLDPSSAQAQALRAAGFALCEDGMEIVLDGASPQR